MDNRVSSGLVEAFDQLTKASLELATIASPQAWLLSLFVFAHMTIFDAPSAAWLSTITFDLSLLTELTRDAHGTLALGGAILALFRTFWTRGIGTAPIILVIVGRGLLKVLQVGIWTNVCLTGTSRGSQVHGQGCYFVHFLGRLIASAGSVDPKQIRYKWGKQPRLSHTNPHTLPIERDQTRDYRKISSTAESDSSIALQNC